jgi:hypothetical protein
MVSLVFLSPLLSLTSGNPDGPRMPCPICCLDAFESHATARCLLECHHPFCIACCYSQAGLDHPISTPSCTACDSCRVSPVAAALIAAGAVLATCTLHYFVAEEGVDGAKPPCRA